MAQCSVDDCEDSVAVRLHVPWGEDRDVCTAHARVWAQKEGVVARPIEGTESEWP